MVNDMLRVSLMSSSKKILFLGLFFSWSIANSAEFCSDQYYIEATLPNESKWDLCWEHRQREGIIYHHIHYTPKNGSRQQILYNAAVAQIHVPYDDNVARYHDVSDYGIGGVNMQALTDSECPGGSLKQFSGKKILCQQIEHKHLAHHDGSESLHGDALSLFSISEIGAYHYLPQWRFFDNGTIQPSMGATGALQRFSNGNSERGWTMNGSRTGIAHLHNFFWRLDFDLGTSGTDDYVEELNFPLVSGKRERSETKFSSEVAREINPTTLRSWRVVDGNVSNDNGHKKSFEILLGESGHKDKGPSNEPYTHNDFFITKAKQCEKFASHNPTTNGCAKNLAEFVNGESVSNQDLIVWVGLTFYHMPRVEDAPHMDAHWNHFDIVPRDWHASNPLGTINTPINTAPSITTPENQTNQVGDVSNLAIIANDSESDTLTYFASGLPDGLTINSSTGVITGTINASAVGTTNVILTVGDGQLSDSAPFSWVVSSANPVNVPPTIVNPGNQSSTVGDSASLQIDASDFDNDTLSYSAIGLAPGLTINNTTGLISGTLAAGSSGNTYIVNITVSDGQASNSQSFNWKVNTASSGGNGIQIDGNDSDWSQISSHSDTQNENLSPVDIESISITGDENSVYLAYRDRQAIDQNQFWAWQLLIDTDYQSNTGLVFVNNMGADYLVEGDMLYKYSGDGESWEWDLISAVDAKINGNFAELAINRSIIGSSTKLKMTFYGANGYVTGSTSTKDLFYIDVNHINRANGNSNGTNEVVIDGESNDWSLSDAISDEAEADTSPVDFQSVWFKQNNEKAYFAYKNRIDIDSSKFWAWVVFIDSDKRISTGLDFYGNVGADFILFGNSLFKYAGTGEDWKWTFIRKVSSAVNGKFAELAVDKSDLNSSSDYKLVFYGSNAYAGGVANDSVPNLF